MMDRPPVNSGALQSLGLNILLWTNRALELEMLSMMEKSFDDTLLLVTVWCPVSGDLEDFKHLRQEHLLCGCHCEFSQVAAISNWRDSMSTSSIYRDTWDRKAF